MACGYTGNGSLNDFRQIMGTLCHKISSIDIMIWKVHNIKWYKYRIHQENNFHAVW